LVSVLSDSLVVVPGVGTKTRCVVVCSKVVVSVTVVVGPGSRPLVVVADVVISAARPPATTTLASSTPAARAMTSPETFSAHATAKHYPAANERSEGGL
jgi:hypothetical protein